ncbi:dehydrogenase/reductase SDR family member 11-like [Schistocerca gregaria]|uniref:dehydrogenase/reductase SDR family member 11-like n=1 Tax=Schistocerca gregaria TaxID=7010 RepID=UPI00211E4C2E|nr:dehydrogenase/reductase SDR family member 11-like [Schistocerca gregaria]XP_049856769.1 dehydrogenase/reductase SDR family member 11-like [Schistocerca gregaria]
MGIEKYAGRVALVTGASSGMGAAIVQELLKHGIHVVGLARRVELIKALEVKGSPGKLYALQGDVGKEESILSAFKWIRENLKGVDILVNSAGVDYDTDFISGKTEHWRQMFEVNELGLAICSREAVQDMMRRGVDDGFVIHISSTGAHIPMYVDGLGMHSANKTAVRVMAEGLRKDLVAKKSNIRVGQISPGVVLTNAMNQSERWAENLKSLPYLEAEDIAKAVVYMLSQHPRVQVHDIIIRPTGEYYG